MLYLLIILLILVVILWLLWLFYNYDITILWSDRKTKLKNLLRAAANIPIYKNRSLEKFEEIRPITKKEMMKNIENTIQPKTLTSQEIYDHAKFSKHNGVSLKNNEYVICTSSSETGIFINNWKTWVQSYLILFKELYYNNPWSNFITPAFTGFRVVFIMMYNWMVGVSDNFFVNTLYICLHDDEDSIVARINKFKPNIIHTYPSILESILGKLEIDDPIIITTGSDYLTNNLKKRIRNKFKSTIIKETYGCTECTFIGSSCKYGNIHINNNCILELVDKNMNIITEKNIRSDKVLLTNLINTYQPLIKYVLDDNVEYIDCFCESENPAITFHGKRTDMLYLTDIFNSLQMHSCNDIDSVFSCIEGEFTYQIISEKQNQFIIYIAIHGETKPENIYNNIRSELNRYLCSHNLSDIKYEIKTCSKIKRNNKTGKITQIIQNLSN